MKKQAVALVGLVMLAGVVLADTNFPMVVPAVPAQPEATVMMKAVITTVACRYMPPAFTSSVYMVMYQIQDPVGKVVKQDMIQITQAQLAGMADPTIMEGMAKIGAAVNALLADRIAHPPTNSVRSMVGPRTIQK